MRSGPARNRTCVGGLQPVTARYAAKIKTEKKKKTLAAFKKKKKNCEFAASGVKSSLSQNSNPKT